MRHEIERELGLTAINFYGLSEMCGPGVAAECLVARDGLHVQEDHFIAEVLDPDSGDPVQEGTTGELVLTTLTKEAMPLIRYRTGDLVTASTAPCRCGRNTMRLTALSGRRDDMMLIRGVNVYPAHVEQLMLSVDGVARPLPAGRRANGALDELRLECEPMPGAEPDALGLRIARHLREHMGLRVEVAVLDPGSIPRSEGKAVRVIDRRVQGRDPSAAGPLRTPRTHRARRGRRARRGWPPGRAGCRAGSA